MSLLCWWAKMHEFEKSWLVVYDSFKMGAASKSNQECRISVPPLVIWRKALSNVFNLAVIGLPSNKYTKVYLTFSDGMFGTFLYHPSPQMKKVNFCFNVRQWGGGWRVANSDFGAIQSMLGKVEFKTNTPGLTLHQSWFCNWHAHLVMIF